MELRRRYPNGDVVLGAWPKPIETWNGMDIRMQNSQRAMMDAVGQWVKRHDGRVGKVVRTSDMPWWVYIDWKDSFIGVPQAEKMTRLTVFTPEEAESYPRHAGVKLGQTTIAPQSKGITVFHEHELSSYED